MDAKSWWSQSKSQKTEKGSLWNTTPDRSCTSDGKTATQTPNWGSALTHSQNGRWVSGSTTNSHQMEPQVGFLLFSPHFHRISWQLSHVQPTETHVLNSGAAVSFTSVILNKISTLTCKGLKPTSFLAGELTIHRTGPDQKCAHRMFLRAWKAGESAFHSLWQTVWTGVLARHRVPPGFVQKYEGFTHDSAADSPSEATCHWWWRR